MKRLVTATVLCLAVFVTQGDAQAPGPTFYTSYELHPHSRLANPEITPNTEFLRTAETRVATFTLGGTYPLVLGQGRTIVISEFAYQRFDLDHKGYASSVTLMENLTSLNYTATVIRNLSDRWRVMGLMTPGIASDLEGSIDQDDFTFQAVAILVRTYSPKLQVGYGIAWANTFGQPFPLPVLSADWNNGGRLRVSTILPAKLELWFAATQRSDYGMEFNIGGNQYHLDPEIYGVGNPLLKYSAMTLGPSVSHRFSEAIAVKAHGGVSFGRRFEYADGEDELADYGMESAAFAMVKLEVVP